jgi:N-acylneuraminate cytidylyltransferase
MSEKAGLLAIIPARGGSKGLPGKNIRPFAGIPLIAHTVLLAKNTPEVDRVLVTTDSAQIAEAAKRFGADVPFLRPAELSNDTVSLWPVVKHALNEAEKTGRYKYVVLLDPTTPCRMPTDISNAFKRLVADPNASGIVGVSEPDFNPYWVSVVERNGYISDLFSDAADITCRQDAPQIFRINGSLYIWNTDFIKAQPEGWRKSGRHLLYQTPDFLSISIDTLEQFQRAELFVKNGFVKFPWLEKNEVSSHEY